jgi:murein DD-endopeptidase MepM/ murein hydrolase activator NlpD
MVGHSCRGWIGLMCAAYAGVVLSADAEACATDVGAPAKEPSFIHPASGMVMTAFGLRVHPLLNTKKHHDGIDYVANIGDPIHAAADGEVRFAESKGQFGIAIEIQHDAGWVTFYAHLSRPSVRAGDCVRAGDIIGASGDTGFSTGPHLHFEIRHNGAHVDPAKLLDMNGRNCVIVCPSDQPCMCETSK